MRAPKAYWRTTRNKKKRLINQPTTIIRCRSLYPRYQDRSSRWPAYAPTKATHIAAQIGLTGREKTASSPSCAACAFRILRTATLCNHTQSRFRPLQIMLRSQTNTSPDTRSQQLWAVPPMASYGQCSRLSPARMQSFCRKIRRNRHAFQAKYRAASRMQDRS